MVVISILMVLLIAGSFVDAKRPEGPPGLELANENAIEDFGFNVGGPAPTSIDFPNDANSQAYENAPDPLYPG